MKKPATPAALADRMVKLANIKPGMRVLDANAGRGHLIEAIWRVDKTVDVFAVEADSANIDHLRGLKDGGPLCVFQGDFLGMHPREQRGFDRVLVDPPFSLQLDIEYVTHAFNFLRPGGRLVALVSKSVESSTTERAREFRALVKHFDGEVHQLDEHVLVILEKALGKL